MSSANYDEANGYVRARLGSGDLDHLPLIIMCFISYEKRVQREKCRSNARLICVLGYNFVIKETAF